MSHIEEQSPDEVARQAAEQMMRGDIPRFRIVNNCADDHPNGAYVLYTDHIGELAELRKALEAANVVQCGSLLCPWEARALAAERERAGLRKALREATDAVQAMFCPGMETPYLAKRGWSRSQLGERKWFHQQHGNILRNHIEAIGIELKPIYQRLTASEMTSAPIADNSP